MLAKLWLIPVTDAPRMPGECVRAGESCVVLREIAVQHVFGKAVSPIQRNDPFAAGDLLDEISFAHNEIGLAANALYEMVTTKSANVLRLRNGEGHLKEGSIADLIAVRNKGLTPAETVAQLTFDQVELVVLSGRIQLASPALYDRLADTLKAGLQPLTIGGHRRWLRAPRPRAP